MPVRFYQEIIEAGAGKISKTMRQKSPLKQTTAQPA